MPWLSKYRVADHLNDETVEMETEAKTDVASSFKQSNGGPATAREAMLEDEIAHLRLQLACLQSENNTKKKKTLKSTSNRDDVSI
jgi:hypothetical protein